MSKNIILMTDSYKASHFLQYPPGTTGMFSYLESRGGKYDRTMFFGLQYLLKRYLSKRVTHVEVDEAKAFFAAHGTPFPEAGWRRVVDVHGGYLPIRVRALPEGYVVQNGNVLLTVESLDPECFWLVTWVESLLLRLWYPITVATQSWHVRRFLREYLRETGSDAGLNFKLHDFGARGVSSHESAGIGGAAHLAAGWMGSDTVEGVLVANEYYDCPMAAYSIPAAEHSTITTWGPEREHDAFDNMLAQFGGPGKIVACVSDSFDIFAAVDYWISQSGKIAASGTKLVVRPDSGDPETVVLKILDQFKAAGLMKANDKGFLELPKHFGVIQGDGVNPMSIRAILHAMRVRGYAADNLAFGMGGALLQQVNRDTQKFAYKCSAVKVGDEWRDVWKDPVTDPGKQSKRGRLDLTGTILRPSTVALQGAGPAWDTLLHTVYETGIPASVYGPGHTWTALESVRERAAYCMDNA